MSKIEKNHEIVGKKLADLNSDLDIGSLYPVIDNDQTIIGVYSAEFGRPDGYRLDSILRAYVPTVSPIEINGEQYDVVGQWHRDTKNYRGQDLDGYFADAIGVDSGEPYTIHYRINADELDLNADELDWDNADRYELV